ncbi:MAG: hypothetical protein KDC03_21565, partial [Flavobacteriales bacterium]|nr:hypothetical protein [Flavobacteriales bacterium]
SSIDPRGVLIEARGASTVLQGVPVKARRHLIAGGVLRSRIGEFRSFLRRLRSRLGGQRPGSPAGRAVFAVDRRCTAY